MMGDSEHLRMVMLRILKHAEPAYYKEISPVYSIEMLALASDP